MLLEPMAYLQSLCKAPRSSSSGCRLHQGCSAQVPLLPVKTGPRALDEEEEEEEEGEEDEDADADVEEG